MRGRKTNCEIKKELKIVREEERKRKFELHEPSKTNQKERERERKLVLHKKQKYKKLHIK